MDVLGASPETFQEQTDIAESPGWQNREGTELSKQIEQRNGKECANENEGQGNIFIVNMSPPNIEKTSQSKKVTVKKSPSARKSFPNNKKVKKNADVKLTYTDVDNQLADETLGILNERRPLPVYRPAVLEFGSCVRQTFICVDCGDSFLFEKSLDQHVHRQSMSVSFACPQCKRKVIFYNRCTFRTHVRNHCMDPNQLDAASVCVNAISGSMSNSCLSWLEFSKEAQAMKSPVVSVQGVSSALLVINKTCSTPTSVQQTSTTSKPLMLTVPASKSVLQTALLLTPLNSLTKPQTITAFTCSECKEEFSTHLALGRHFGKGKTVWKQTELRVCSICQHKLTPSTCSLSAHLRIHRRETPYTCPDCGIVVQGSWDVFLYHLRHQCFHYSRCIGYTCHICSVCTYNQSTMLRSHILNSHSESYFKCPGCPMAFKTNSGFENHFTTAHPTKKLESAKSIYKCPECDTVFHKRSQLQSHVDNHIQKRTHEVQFIYKCLDCYRLFDNQIQIYEHNKTHSHTEHIVCCLCGAVCKSQTDLTMHTFYAHNSITGNQFRKIQPKVSSSVSFSCALKGDETLKQKSVTSSAKIRCLECKACLPDHQSLVSHIREAHKDCPNMCMTCGGTFMSKSGMSLHGKRHQQDGCHVCSSCNNLPFPDAEMLNLHILSSHSKQTSLKAQQKNKEIVDSLDAVKSSVPVPVIKMKKFSASELRDSKTSGQSKTEEENLTGVAKIKEELYEDRFSAEAERERLEALKKRLEQPKTCEECGLECSTVRDLEQHVQDIHLNKTRPYLCWLCKQKNFPNKKLLQRHIVNKHNITAEKIRWEDLHLPEKRKLKLKTVGSGISHTSSKRLRVVGDDTYTCVKCDFCTNDSAAFQNHIGEHKEPASYQCSECGMCFVVAPALKKHLLFVHKVRRAHDILIEEKELEEELSQDPENSSLECTVCYKIFENEGILKTHMRSHGMAFIRSKRYSN